MIYSEHFFEHLQHPRDTTRFLSEAFRLLEQGGVFSVGVPDTEWPLKAYSDDKDPYFPTAKKSGIHQNAKPSSITSITISAKMASTNMRGTSKH